MRHFFILRGHQSLKRIFYSLLIFFCTIFTVNGQAPYRFYAHQSTGNTFMFGNTNLIGLSGASSWPGQNVFTPSANLHIRQTEQISATPLLKLELYNAGDLGSLKFLFRDVYDYAILQSNQSHLNHFKGRVIVGPFESGDFLSLSSNWLAVKGPIALQNKMTFLFNLNNHISNITWESQDPDDVFTFTNFNLTTKQSTIPLILDPMLGVTVQGLLKTNQFMLVDGAGANKILLSDQVGHGVWTNLSEFHDDDWIPTLKPNSTTEFNIHLNEKYLNAGIGTTDPQSKLHVVDGNIMISRSPAKAPGSRNGSILFGKLIDEASPLGEWGIEYQDDLTTYMNGGLNFWKVYTELNPGKDHALFIRNDGFVGIGTASPQSELSVNGKITAKEIEVLAVGWVPDFVFEDDYKLKSLGEVESYILSNKHLPDVPSADEIKENGMNLSEMNSILLKKVEELTLYVIQLKKEIQQIKASKDEQ